LYILILILILASPYLDGIHRGLTLVPAHVGYDGSGNATRFGAVFHAPNAFLSRSIISWRGMLNFPHLRKYVMAIFVHVFAGNVV